MFLPVGARTSCPPEREARTILRANHQGLSAVRALAVKMQALRQKRQFTFPPITIYYLFVKTPLHSDHDFTIHGFQFTEVR